MRPSISPLRRTPVHKRIRAPAYVIGAEAFDERAHQRRAHVRLSDISVVANS